MSKLTLAVISLLTLGASSSALAGDDNNCGKLSMLITNSTKQTCKLVHKNVNHGFITYTSHVPAFIAAHSTAPALVLTQPFIGSGPDIDLTYECGNGKTVSIHTKQNYCFLAAGNIKGYVISKNNLTADYSATKGSYFWNQHGTVNWAFND